MIPDLPPPAAVAPVQQIDFSRLLWAIAQVESGGDWTKEGGALQICRTTWVEAAHMLPYKLAQFKPQAEIVGMMILRRNAATFVRFGITPDLRMMSDAWRFGVSGAMRRAKEGKVSDYATRVINLFESNHPTS